LYCVVCATLTYDFTYESTYELPTYDLLLMTYDFCATDYGITAATLVVSNRSI